MRNLQKWRGVAGLIKANHDSTGHIASDVVASKVLRAAVQFWFVVAVIGQWAFAAYIAAYYGGAAMRGDMEMWNKVFPRGHMAGDTLGNFFVAVHLLLAVVVTVGGPLQLIPRIRAVTPAFHRWNGRVYLLAAIITSMAGLYMLFARGSVGGAMQHSALFINAVLIILCAAMTLRYALARQFAVHRRWALRLFLLVSGVWFFRVGLMLWLVVNRGPAGFDPDSFQGPFLSFLAFAQYLLPLALLELYFYVQDRTRARGHITMAVGIALLTLAMAAGIAAAIVMLWLPRL